MRPVIYQLFVRHFSNTTEQGVPWGSREQNGCGTFNGVNDAALQAIAHMGVTHLWLTGVLRHATQTSHPGLPADPACVVKGIAGSPYAVTDYFDVDPDLAVDVENRMAEFRALLARVRRWGMIPMLDFIPNHVSRCYASQVNPACSFGAQDDTGVFFARDNAFYYLEPCHSDRELHLPDGPFAPETGCGRVTGNNAATWTPSAYDWYETAKLNYGTDYRHGAAAAMCLPGPLSPASHAPRTWRIMDSIVDYWQEQGVGAFRCDMAHMVPVPFWRWLIANSRLRDSSVFFMAEAYNDHMKLTPGDAHADLLAAGFNGVYDSSAYQALRQLYEQNSWANDLDRVNNSSADLFAGGVRYLENHDEPRMAAPAYWGGVGEKIAPAAMTAQYASTSAPVLFYNGQEVAERADGPGGYGGDNGRTSIFDYTCLPRLQQWYNHGRCDAANLPPHLAALRSFSARLLPLLQLPALSKGGFYGLNWANQHTPHFGRAQGDTVSGHYLYAFLRHYRKAKSTVLVICNLSPDTPADTCVHIPANAIEWAGKKPGSYTFRHLLDATAPEMQIDSTMLQTQGLAISIPPGSAIMLEWN
ncbi:MAG: hypothetical protein II349_01110 [Akkermansia sp.]|nr:hypothetical protein [Akkermansia sp.]